MSQVGEVGLAIDRCITAIHGGLITYRWNCFSLGSPSWELEDWDSILLSCFSQGVCPSLDIRNGEYCSHIVTLVAEKLVHLRREGRREEMDNIF